MVAALSSPSAAPFTSDLDTALALTAFGRIPKDTRVLLTDESGVDVAQVVRNPLGAQCNSAFFFSESTVRRIAP